MSRPGEAIYNDQGGLVEANSPFQISWLPDEQREEYLQLVQKRATKEAVETPEANVFEGNQPADITKNRKLQDAIAAREWSKTASASPFVWLGEPVAIKEPTVVPLRSQSGANILVIGIMAQTPQAFGTA